MQYVEEKVFNLRIELRREFPDDYEGEADGYAWLADWPAIAAELAQAAAQVLRRRGGWQVRPANRGRSAEDEISLVATERPGVENT